MRTGENSAFSWKMFLISCLIGGGIAVAAALVILVGATALVLGGVLDVGSSVIAADISAALGALAGGYIAEKRSNVGALPCGAAVAAVQLLICMLVGLVFYESFLPADGGIALAISMLVGALVGALLGTRRGRAGPRRRSKK